MVKVSRYMYLAASWLFVVGVTTQVFLAGMVVVALKMRWDAHIGLGHMLAGPLLFMLVSMYLGKLPRPMKILTWSLFVVYALQADVLIFLRVQAPVLAAFHPVMALLDFALGVMLARQAWGLVRQPRPVADLEPGLDSAVIK